MDNNAYDPLANYEAALSRYEQARHGLKCAANDLIQHNLSKLAFHIRGIWRALIGI